MISIEAARSRRLLWEAENPGKCHKCKGQGFSEYLAIFSATPVNEIRKQMCFKCDGTGKR